MNILRLIYDWPPPWDGLAPAPFEISRAQAALGHKIAVFCGGGSKFKIKSEKFKVGRGEVSVYRFPRALKRFSLFLTTAPAVLFGYWIYRLTNKVDIVHGHGHIICWFNIYRLLFGWLDKTPYVLHFHVTAAGREAECKSAGEELGFWTRWFEWPLHKFSDWLGVRVADRVICVSSRVREEAIRFYGAEPEKVVVVENGVNTDLFVPSSHDAPRPPRNILYVGALSLRKNVHLISEALKLLPQSYQLTIIGRGAKEYEDRLHRLTAAAKLQDRVKFAGYVEYAELPRRYQAAHIFVLPSSYEGLPKVVLEALACGVPVLASGFRMAETIQGLEFLEELAPQEIAVRVEQLAENAPAVDVSKVRGTYSWGSKARQIDNIYQELVI